MTEIHPNERAWPRRKAVVPRCKRCASVPEVQHRVGSAADNDKRFRIVCNDCGLRTRWHESMFSALVWWYAKHAELKPHIVTRVEERLYG